MCPLPANKRSMKCKSYDRSTPAAPARVKERVRMQSVSEEFNNDDDPEDNR